MIPHVTTTSSSLHHFTSIKVHSDPDKPRSPIYWTKWLPSSVLLTFIFWKEEGVPFQRCVVVCVSQLNKSEHLLGPRAGARYNSLLTVCNVAVSMFTSSVCLFISSVIVIFSMETFVISARAWLNLTRYPILLVTTDQSPVPRTCNPINSIAQFQFHDIMICGAEDVTPQSGTDRYLIRELIPEEYHYPEVSRNLV